MYNYGNEKGVLGGTPITGHDEYYGFEDTLPSNFRLGVYYPPTQDSNVYFKHIFLGTNSTPKSNQSLESQPPRVLHNYNGVTNTVQIYEDPSATGTPALYVPPIHADGSPGVLFIYIESSFTPPAS